MGNIVLYMSVSLDGYMEGPGRDIGWHVVDDELHRHFNEELAAVGAFVEGRVTYELMEGYWPTADADPSVTGPTAEFARIWREKPKYVFSGTLRKAGGNTTVLRDVDPQDVAALKERYPGGLALGGAGLAATFMRYDLIDEYRVYVHPVVIGRGKPLFPESDTRTRLRLAESRAFGNGVVLLRYERHRGE
ncbi:dihydrofolate reductase family protein [Streptomyces lavendofoliae]|uniref:dihydrofolate reductase family protein n=1 Tax=Streptomyces lavendofoliae TaxID=67314 RepID=UPI003D901396